MRSIILLYILHQFIEVNCGNDPYIALDYNLIDDYLKANDLKVCCILYCDNNVNAEWLKLFHRHMDSGWYNFYDIEDHSIKWEMFLMRLSHQIGIVIDLNCSTIDAFLREMSKRTYFHRERYWLMFSPDLNRTFEVLQKQNLNFDAEVSVAIPVEDSQKKHYRLYEAYNPSSARGGQLYVTQVGKWSVADGYNLIVNKTKLENRRNFEGITFKGVMTITKMPNQETFLDHLESVDNAHLNTINRFNYRLFVIMQQMYNFTIFLQRADIDGDLKNGRWSGAIGMVHRHEVDICESGLRWRNEYYDTIEATTNSYASQPKFIFRHPTLVDSSTVFTEPFKNVVWLCIALVCIASSYFLRCIFTAENHKKVKVNFGDQSINDSTLSNSLLLVFGILFQQGYSTEPLMISSRILTLSLLVFSVLVSQFYAAFIVGTLLTEAPKTITTIEKLERSQLEFGVDDVSFTLEAFEGSSDRSAVGLFRRIMQTADKSVMDLNEGLDRIKKGGFAFNTEATSSYLKIKKMLNDDEICDLQDIVYSRATPSGPVVPKKSPLTELIKISILRMAETGILAYHSKVWIGSRPDCPDRLVGFVPVDLLHFCTALYLIMFGIVLSFFILLAEIGTNYFQTAGERAYVKDIMRKWLGFGEFDSKRN